MKVLSLGWGVQSFTLAVMSALRDLPRIDAAVHADTTHESALTYDFVNRWTKWLEEHGIRITTVSDKVAARKILDDSNQTFIPAFSGSGGQAIRSCTQRWKIAPMRRWLQAQRKGERVDLWMGISLDEFQRMKDSNVKYITNVYPLIDMKMTREDCKKYLAEKDIECPPRSACTFCPFHDTAEWRRIKGIKADWENAVSVDEHIRNLRPPHTLFVHPSRKPLASVDFRTMKEKGQMSFWDSECTGICGV